jgi:lipopolysaccharide/colanic/teichoic acid biosynthesis glycosyltransferase
MIYKLFLKRLLDVFLSLFLLVIISPFFFTLIIVLYVQNSGQPFFFQERPGYQQRAFRIIKFKTMTDARDENGLLLPDRMRITRLGATIRKWSLDEIPQLINVVKGEMSLIGPRPLLFKYIPLYNPEQLRRHEVRPGITGWAQVNGRNSISWNEKFSLDIFYVNHLSFMLDIKIFWLTFLKVVKKEGVNQSADQPMQPFNGFN